MPSGKFLISSIRLSDDSPLRVVDHSIPVIENEFVCVSVPETVRRPVAGFFPARKLLRDEIEFEWVAKMSSPMSFDFEIPWGNNQDRSSIAFEGTEIPPLGGLVKRFRFENHLDFDGEVKLPIFSGRESLDDLIEVRSSDSQLEVILQNEDRCKILCRMSTLNRNSMKKAESTPVIRYRIIPSLFMFLAGLVLISVHFVHTREVIIREVFHFWEIGDHATAMLFCMSSTVFFCSGICAILAAYCTFKKQFELGLYLFFGGTPLCYIFSWMLIYA